MRRSFSVKVERLSERRRWAQVITAPQRNHSTTITEPGQRNMQVTVLEPGLVRRRYIR